MAVWTFRIYNNPVTPTLIPFLRLFRRNIPAIFIPPKLLTILFTTDAWSDAKSCAWKYHIWRRAINGNYRSDSRLHTEPLLFLRNHRFEKRSMVHGKLLFPLLVSIFIIVGKSTTTRDSTRFQSGGIFASSDNSGSPCLSQSEIEAEKKITLIREWCLIATSDNLRGYHEPRDFYIC